MFKRIYANGCSFTCAGGLDDKNIRKKYKEILDINLEDDYIQYAYPNIVAKKLNLSITNESQSGGSVNRVIRKTYEYVYKNSSTISETLFILELPPMWREEIYSNEFNRVLNICPATITDPDSGIPAAFNGYKTNDIKNLSKNLQSYFYNFINVEFEYKKSMNNLLGLLHFLKNNNIRFVLIDNCFFEKFLRENNLNTNLSINFNNEFDFISFSDIAMYVWFSENKMTINDELGINMDGHAGYYGNQKIANIVLDYIRNKKLSKIII